MVGPAVEGAVERLDGVDVAAAVVRLEGVYDPGRSDVGERAFGWCVALALQPGARARVRAFGAFSGQQRAERFAERVPHGLRLCRGGR